MSKIPFQNFPPARFRKINSENNFRYWLVMILNLNSSSQSYPQRFLKQINTIFMSKHILVVK